MNQEKAVCFTGHRSQKLPWRFRENDARCKKMKATLREEIEKAIQRGYCKFYCGMALGFDMICAETVLKLKRKYPHVQLIGAIPCKNQDAAWSLKYRLKYRKLLKQADEIRCIYDEYIGAECFLERNRFMVNHSSCMIALYNGLSGGTKYTVEYARRKGLEIVIITP